jgi:hypothetical protein
MRFKPSVAYLVLLVSSLAIPVLHYFLADRAIEHTRGGTLLLPAQFLLWRWLGELACALPVSVVGFFLLSLKYERFSRASTILGVAAAQAVFTTFYAAYCAFLLSHLLLLDKAG